MMCFVCEKSSGKKGEPIMLKYDYQIVKAIVVNNIPNHVLPCIRKGAHSCSYTVTPPSLITIHLQELGVKSPKCPFHIICSSQHIFSTSPDIFAIVLPGSQVKPPLQRHHVLTPKSVYTSDVFHAFACRAILLWCKSI